MIYYIIIYTIGFIFTYLYTKKIRNDVNSNNWEDVITSIIVSFFSWIGFLVCLIYFPELLLKIKSKSKPPKWL